MDQTMYAIGRVFARLERAGVASQDRPDYERVSMSPATALPPLIAQLIATGRGDDITALMAEIGDLPGHPSEIKQGDFALGYWHEKAALNPRMGRPPELEDATRLEMRLPSALLQRVDAARGDTSRAAWIRGAIEARLSEIRVPNQPSERVYRDEEGE